MHGMLAIKGPTLPGLHDPRCAIEAGRLGEHAADPAHGFAWPYLLVTGKPAPGAIARDRLFVLPNNTGFATASLDVRTGRLRRAPPGQADVRARRARRQRRGAVARRVRSGRQRADHARVRQDAGRALGRGALYAAARLDATFTLYPGVGHEVSPAMQADIAAGFRAALAR
jgi:hypothetical protein